MSNHADDTVETKSADAAADRAEQPAEEEATTAAESEEPASSEAPADEEPAEEPAVSQAAEPNDKDKEEEEEHEPFEEDGRADQALDFVVAVLSKMGMDCTVDLMENDDNDPPTDVRIEINGNDANRLIGRKGQTLSALQFIANRVINRPSMVRRHVLIDSDGYRARREQALSSMATRLGKQAVAEGKIITFEPMSAQDRRVVHLALAKFPGVVTKSEGKGATRRVQIIPVRE